MTSSILLTIDVEDWFQVENFKTWIPFSAWDRCELRVERNTNRLLELLSSIGGTGPDNLSPRATFFVLGWLARRMPGLVRKIHAQGHEVASHGYFHRLTSQQSAAALFRELKDSRCLLEDTIGHAVAGYRAPSFSVSIGLLRLVREAGYDYDSSYNSFAMNSRYGQLDLSGLPGFGIARRISTGLVELPVSNLRFGNRILPWSGGGYFRLIPPRLFKAGVRQIFHQQDAYLFYMHPWEIDPEQPRVRAASAISRIRHYINLQATLDRLRGFISSFKDLRFITCRSYLNEG